MSKTIKVVRKTTKTPKAKKVPFTLGVPVNVKVQGEKAMRKHVVLDRHPSDSHKVLVKTGRRGRPAALDVSVIERVRVL